MDPSLPRPAPPRSPIDRLREWVVWFGPGRLAATALAVIAVVAGGTWLLKGSPGRAEDQLPFASPIDGDCNASQQAPPSPRRPPPCSSAIVVYVAGAVTAPGVYTLDGAARVTDALAAAGGAGAGRRSRRGQPCRGGARRRADLRPEGRRGGPGRGRRRLGAADATAPAGPVNVNSATADQLDVLPGVGPTTAAAIVAHREQNGPFQTVEQLGDVRGIGPAKLDALRGLVTV